MDTRLFLLAEHYDSLGLFRVADSLENRIKTSQNTSDPSRGGLDDPNYPVQKPKPNINKKENISIPQKEERSALEIAQSAIEEANPVLQPFNAILSVLEIANASKEVINNYSLSLLKKIAKNGVISSKEIAQVKNIVNNSTKLDAEILKLLKNSINNKIPNIAEVSAITPKWIDSVKVKNLALGFVDKIK